MTRGNMVLEASGGITQESIAAIAATGVDYISCGDLTKSVGHGSVHALFSRRVIGLG